VCVALNFTSRGVFIGVQIGVTDLVKSVTHQVVANWPSHVASWPWSLACTNLQLGISLYRLLESVAAKPTRERLQGVADRPGGLAGWPPSGPTGQQPLHTASSCQVHSQGDTYFGGILNLLVISLNVPIWHLCSRNQINSKIVGLV
jgi:hypothetical protein